MGPALSGAIRAVEPVSRGTDRESAWIDALFRQQCDRVFRYAFAIVGDASAAEDICAELFVRAWQRRRSLRDDSRVTAWLLAIARRLAAENIRGRSRRRRFEVPIEDRDVPCAEEADAPDGGDRIWRCFRKLTSEQQQVLYLRFVEGCTHEEVARLLGRTAGAVRAAQFRALARMRRLLEEDHDA